MNSQHDQKIAASCFVLLHGAFRGGWSWQKVRRILQSKGIEVFSPSLTGAGENVHLLSPEITLQIWVNDIVNLLKSEDLSNVILSSKLLWKT